MTQETTHASTILGLMAQTSIHAGTGQNTGVIDLPIQREGHNGWPCIFGSAVKGAMRVKAEETNLTDLTTVFGPDTKNASDHASAIMVSDARIALLPVRSLTSQFKWVTCPAVINRLYEDMLRFEVATIADKPPESLSITKGNALSVAGNDDVFLEEYRFSVAEQDLTNTLALLTKLINKEGIDSALKEQLLILCNDDFSYLVQHATPVTPHIVIESENKIATNLWYEETLPPETLLYTGISASKSRNKESTLNAQQVLELVTNMFPSEKPWFQIGGNETVGMGWCTVKNANGGE